MGEHGGSHDDAMVAERGNRAAGKHWFSANDQSVIGRLRKAAECVDQCTGAFNAVAFFQPQPHRAGDARCAVSSGGNSGEHRHKVGNICRVKVYSMQCSITVRNGKKE